MRARKVLNVSKALMIWRSAGVKGPQDLEDFQCFDDGKGLEGHEHSEGQKRQKCHEGLNEDHGMLP